MELQTLRKKMVSSILFRRGCQNIILRVQMKFLREDTFQSKKKQYFMNFLKFFRKKLPVCLSKLESTFSEVILGGKNLQIFEETFPVKKSGL